MKIVRAVLHEVIVPANAGCVNSTCYGDATWPRQSKVIVVATTDTGLTAYGESKRGTRVETVARQLRQLDAANLTTICLQEPPLVQLEADELWHQEAQRRSPRLLELNFNNADHWAIHSLLMDLLGKSLGVPAHQLLGGAYRKAVRVDAWMGRMTPDESATVAKRARDAGFRGIKFKCSLEDGDDLVTRAVAIREACGADFKLTIDPNERFYRPVEAIPLVRRLVELGNLGCLEDPFPVERLDWHRQLREAIPGLPIALTVGYNTKLLSATSVGACDFANVKGTPCDTKKAADVCWLAGIPCWLGTGIELGILEAAYVHVAAASKAVSRPCDLFGRLIRSHDLLRQPLSFTEGSLLVPMQPGLGIEIDSDALDQFTVSRTEITG